MTVDTATEVEPQAGVDDGAMNSPDATEISNDVETDAAEVVESSKPTVSEGTLGRADAYGIPRAELEGLSEAQASRVLSAVDRRLMRPADTPARTPQPGAKPEGYVAYEPEYPEDLDEGIVGVLKGFTKHVNDHLAGLHTSGRNIQGELRARDMVREVEGLDRYIAGLGDDWTKEYGTGPTLEMDPQSAEYRARLEVLYGSRNLQADARKRGSPVSAKAAHKRAHGGMHYDKIAERERGKLDGKIAKRRGGFSERPAKGKAATLSAHDDAVEKWKAGG